MENSRLELKIIFKMIRKYLAIILLSAGILVKHGSAIQILEYHEHCSLRDMGKAQCNPDLGLVCNGKQCDCAKTPRLIFEESSKSCVLPIGDFCFSDRIATRKLDYPCPLNATCKTVDPFLGNGRSIPKSLRQAVSSQSHYYNSHDLERCVCDDGFITSGSRCVPALQHGEKCSKRTARCDNSVGLICGSEGKCDCKEPSEYSNSLKACFTKVGKECYPGSFCDANSICSSTLDHIRFSIDIRNIIFRRYSHTSSGRRIKMSKYSKVSTDTCVCAPGFSQNSYGKCVASFHVSCSKDSPCNSDAFLSCTDGICQCEKGSKQFFSEDAGTAACRLKLGEPCKTDEGPHCIKNAECSDSKCKCKSDYSIGSSEACLLTHDSKCIAPIPYEHHGLRDHLNDSCNFYKGLACHNEKCSCFDQSLIWDKDLEMCTAKKGQRCGKFDIIEMGIGADSTRNHDPLYPPLPALHEEAKTIDGDFENSYFVGCHKGFKCVKNEDDIHELYHCQKSKE